MNTFASYLSDFSTLNEDSKEKNPTHFEVAYKMFDKKGRIVSKRKSFKTDKTRATYFNGWTTETVLGFTRNECVPQGMEGGNSSICQ